MTAPNAFVWYELLTTDTEGSQSFYRDVVGWTLQDSGMKEVTGMDYTLITSASGPVAGLMALPATAAAGGGRPGWLGYVGVEDVDAFAARVQQAGGAVHQAPTDIPGVGRFSLVADPQGAPFVLFKAAAMPAPPAEPAGGAPGRIGWHELVTTDWRSAFDFYADLFGWTRDTAIDMGPMGTYQLFATGGTAIGGMMNRPPAVPASFWLYYVNVPDIPAAVARVKALFGQVLHGPAQVPGGSWIVQCLDPQGAMFALVGPDK
jgi:predicted enzyme related to lactoylglutathione lyase